MSQAHDDAVDKRKAKTDEIAALREEVTTPHAGRHLHLDGWLTISFPSLTLSYNACRTRSCRTGWMPLSQGLGIPKCVRVKFCGHYHK